MKKIFIFLILLILTNNNHFFAAQAPDEAKIDAEKQAKIRELKDLFSQLTQNIRNWDANEIARQIEKIKNIFINSSISVDIEFDNRTPLTFIAYHKELNNLAFWLINNGADVNKSEDYMNTSPLYIAALSLNFELVKFLIEHGADANFVNPRIPISVLYIATFQRPTPKDVRNWKEVIKLLLLNGAKYKNDRQFNYTYNLANTDLVTKSLFQLARLEIIDEYSKKIEALNEATGANLIAAGWPKDLPPIVQEYLIPKYAGEQILDNILYIRYLLDELSPIQKQNFEKELNKAKQQQQQHPAAAAAAAQAEQ